MSDKPRTKTLKERRAETGRTLALDGAVWRRLRQVVLRRQPLCPTCQAIGHLVPAVEVDHADDDPTNNDMSNLVGLCKTHHGQKTRGVGVKGCDSKGLPLDPRHPWNSEQRSPGTGPAPTDRPPYFNANPS